jgi:hypothetical protein
MQPQRTLGLGRVARHHHLQARRVAEVGLWRLRVVQPAVTDRAAWRANQKATTVKEVAGAIAVLGSLVDDLVKGREDVVGELNLCNAPVAHGGITDGEAGNALLTQRRVEDAVRPELLPQVHAAAEHAAKGHVLAEQHGVVVAAQGDAHAVVERAKVVHFGLLTHVVSHCVHHLRTTGRR